DLYIEALEDSVVSVIEKNIDSADIDVGKLVKRMAVLQTRVLMLMSARAIDRFDHFQRTYPDIIQRVPQRMVASYLGITPEALSKVKAERLR
ncbi:MAG: Crp/Fnr family transcriptional regulator, partial [Rhodothermales bacterium]|nr:Crp/Fnr family transcriptional regulator [Rhodothermales bacterium]